MKNQFTVPKIAKFPLESGKRWYVWFRFNGGNPIRIFNGLNDITDYQERLLEAQLMADVLHMKLKSGWIPDRSKDVLTKRLIVPAFEEAISRIEPNVSKNTFDAYSGAVRAFVSAIKAKHFARMLASNFTRAHAKQCLEWIRQDRQWSAHSYNKNLGYIRSVFHEIIEAEQAQINPFREIKNIKVTKTPANVPPTDAEMKLICDELRSKVPGFYTFYMLIYYCGLRPDEARMLQVQDLDFKSEMIHLKNTKTGNRSVPMIGPISELLEHAIGLDPQWYVFGTWVNNGGRHSQKNWFAPNPYSLKEDTPNKLWKKLIKDGLGINKSLYSAKHKGADDKLAAGLDKQTICDIFGHSEVKMTERYMHSLKEDRFKKARTISLKSFL